MPQDPSIDRIAWTLAVVVRAGCAGELTPADLMSLNRSLQRRVLAIRPELEHSLRYVAPRPQETRVVTISSLQNRDLRKPKRGTD